MIRKAGKDWARKKRDAAKTSVKVTAELQNAATRLQENPLNSIYQNALSELKEKLKEL